MSDTPTSPSSPAPAPPADPPASPPAKLPEPGTPEHVSFFAGVEEWLREHVPGAVAKDVTAGEKALEAAGRVAGLLPRVLKVVAGIDPGAADKLAPLVAEAEKIAADLGL